MSVLLRIFYRVFDVVYTFIYPPSIDIGELIEIRKKMIYLPIYRDDRLDDAPPLKNTQKIIIDPDDPFLGSSVVIDDYV